MLKKGLENNYEDSDRCKHSKPAIDIFKAGRGRNTPKKQYRCCLEQEIIKNRTV